MSDVPFVDTDRYCCQPEHVRIYRRVRHFPWYAFRLVVQLGYWAIMRQCQEFVWRTADGTPFVRLTRWESFKHLLACEKSRYHYAMQNYYTTEEMLEQLDGRPRCSSK